ncbi:hypothetical protein BOX15_Mlig015957g1, partial [Macrostomum lignano]
PAPAPTPSATPAAPPSGGDRVIALIDMDCFYVQVELQHCPESIGKPAVVVQYTGAGLLAVSYEARALGVRRHMRLADAQRICPSLKVFQVPEKRGKADISRYRQASDAVMSALSQLSTQFQKASIDEAYVDLTERVDGMLAESSDSCLDMLKPERLKSTCMAVGGQEALSDWLNGCLATAAGMTREQRLRYHDLRLAVGACLVEDVRSEVRARLGYNCSAGLAGTKTLAKISAGANKPARQTLAPWSMAPELMAPMPLDRVPRLGGKLGRAISALLGGNATVADVLAASEASVLSAELDSASVRYARELCRGLDGGEAVVPRLAQTSLGCSKNFYEPIRDSATLRRWLGELGDELFERLTQDRVEHRRWPGLLCVAFGWDRGSRRLSKSRQLATDFWPGGREHFLRLLEALVDASGVSVGPDSPLGHLHVSVGKFRSLDCSLGENRDIKSLLMRQGAANAARSTATAASADATESCNLDYDDCAVDDNNEDSSNGSAAAAGVSADKPVNKTAGIISFFTASTSTANNNVNCDIRREARAAPTHSVASALEVPNDRQQQTDQPSSSSSDEPLTVECSQCRPPRAVLMTDWLEHQDYHAAVDLQRSIQLEFKAERDRDVQLLQQSRKRPATSSSSSAGKNKRRSTTSTNNNSSSANGPTLDSYFRKA